ncbi:hypothetical protein NE237_028544 [Protea cynaroides]|uniref:Uncharacterized protein n=1 Tax=Protea cynaroides TaxID=273540 RepID=A0A9Q0GPI7_9MAGN|nr:hypothetical protein NE237_028544 [Protea cynaroides]
MVPFLLLLEGVALFSVWSDIREIDAQPAMSDNGAEVVNLSAPQQWHTTLDLTAGPVTFRNGGSPLATTTLLLFLRFGDGGPTVGNSRHKQLDRRGPALLLLHRGAVRSQKQGMSRTVEGHRELTSS